MPIVLFRSKLVPEPEGYAEMAQEMEHDLEVAEVVRRKQFVRPDSVTAR
jgi:hypothetical protein